MATTLYRRVRHCVVVVKEVGANPGHGTWLAAEVFAGPTMTVEDDRRDYGEVDYIANGDRDEGMRHSSDQLPNAMFT